MSQAIQLVVFDLGGVLVHVAASWDEAVSSAGLPPHPAFETATFREAHDRAMHALMLGAMTPAEYCHAISRACSGAYSRSEVERVLTAWLRHERPGVGGVFDALDATGVETALLSNTNAAHWSRLAAIDATIPEYPVVLRAKHHFPSHLLGLVKPDRAIFEAVGRMAGVDPRGILFFDDIDEYVAAARNAGWHAERIDPTEDTAAQMLEGLRRHEVLPASLAPPSAR